MLDFTGRLADMGAGAQLRAAAVPLPSATWWVNACACAGEYLDLKAERSGAAADREQARQAEADFDAYRRSTAHTPAPRPELDDDEQDELRRLYRAAAVRCHPDRAEAERAEAHDVFLRVQAAYQARDLAGLRAITAELAGGRASATTGAPQAGSAAPASKPSGVGLPNCRPGRRPDPCRADPATGSRVPAGAAQVERWETHFAGRAPASRPNELARADRRTGVASKLRPARGARGSKHHREPRPRITLPARTFTFLPLSVPADSRRTASRAIRARPRRGWSGR